MYQQEIQFFWPLTEQTELDLDFTPCQEYATAKYANAVIGANGLCLTVSSGGTTSWGTVTVTPPTLSSMSEFRPNPESVGYWEITKDLRYYVSVEPNWIVKKMTKFLLGWKWGKN
jgi:hypothetical protein